MGSLPLTAGLLLKSSNGRELRSIAAGDFTLGKLDKYGQRITITIDLHGQGQAAGRSTQILSGWMIRGDGSITLNTPFTGFTK
jgi:hypothetical protein